MLIKAFFKVLLILFRSWFKYSLRHEISRLQVIRNSFLKVMVLTKKFKAFDDAILDLHPELKEVLKPNDQYPELENLLKKRYVNLPSGSLNTKVIINDGEIVERVFKTPMGKIVSLFSKQPYVILDQVA